jgi:hypothetical protein
MEPKLRFQKRRELQAQLATKYQWEMHVTHKASGRVSAVTVELAAQLIIDGSHLEATEAEMAAHLEEQRLRGEEIAARTRGIKRTNFRPNDGESDPNARIYRYAG